MKNLSIFDFDGTISYRDTFIPFLMFYHGGIFYLKLIKLLPHISKFIFKKIDRNSLKERLIFIMLKGESRNRIEDFSRDFWKQNKNTILREKAKSQILSEINEGRLVYICSASPDVLLREVAECLHCGLISTQIEFDSQNITTGYLIGKNCRGKEKVTRIKDVFGDKNEFHLRAWGDSPGDHEMLALADEAFWKPFR